MSWLLSATGNTPEKVDLEDKAELIFQLGDK